jgi:hypothetical protein
MSNLRELPETPIVGAGSEVPQSDRYAPRLVEALGRSQRRFPSATRPTSRLTADHEPNRHNLLALIGAISARIRNPEE